MASKQMIRRVQSALDATYRAWDFNREIAERVSAHPADVNDAHWWETCYQIMQALNRMQIEGRSDNEITHAWMALRTEVRLPLSLAGYGMFVRAIYPAPRPDALSRCHAAEQRPDIRLLRAQQTYTRRSGAPMGAQLSPIRRVAE